MTPTTTFDFISGHVALDFVNTVANRLDRETTRELLNDADDLADWALVSEQPEFAGVSWKRALRSDDDALARVRAMREALHRIALAYADGKAVPGTTLHAIDAELRRCVAHRRLGVHGGAVAWEWTSDARGADKLLLPILTAAVELFGSIDRERIKQCDGPGCGWLFLDRSKTGQRRWCSMKDCGNRAKARRHYRKTQEGDE